MSNQTNSYMVINPALRIFLFVIMFSLYDQAEAQQRPADFLPRGYVIFETIKGDLNKDGVEDCVLIIKATDKNLVVNDEYKGRLDRNRRGIIVLFKKGDQYELAVKNHSCFSSENEDGGVYYPPELSVKIQKAKLYIEYAHGRYGYWRYTFRFQNNDLELIGYDRTEHDGPAVATETSINFLSKKKQTKVNTNENAQGGDEVFKETWKTINITQLLKLSQIKDFDGLVF